MKSWSRYQVVGLVLFASMMGVLMLAADGTIEVDFDLLEYAYWGLAVGFVGFGVYRRIHQSKSDKNEDSTRVG